MSIPVVLNVSHIPIRVPHPVMNGAYTNGIGIVSSDMNISDEAINDIVNVVRESYKASAGKLLTKNPSADVIYGEQIHITSVELLAAVEQSITYHTIQTLGNELITQHMREQTAPFYVGDIYSFDLILKPGSFVILNDTPTNIYEGVTFFSSTVDGHPITTSPGESATISQWIYTTNADVGPYYDGSAETGFIVNMAFKVI